MNKEVIGLLNSFSKADLEISISDHLEDAIDLRNEYFDYLTLIFGFVTVYGFNNLEKEIKDNVDLTKNERENLLFLLVKLPYIYPQGMERTNRIVARKNKRKEELAGIAISAMLAFTLSQTSEMIKKPSGQDASQSHMVSVMEEITFSDSLSSDEKIEILKKSFKKSDTEELKAIYEKMLKEM